MCAEQRLTLFAQDCHAVQHAHQKGIIRRDIIKLTNVWSGVWREAETLGVPRLHALRRHRVGSFARGR